MRKIIALLALIAAAPASASMLYVERHDPITDHLSAFAAVQSGESAFMIGCEGRNRSLGLAFIAGRHLRSTGWLNSAGELTYRFDRDEPITSTWYYDGDKVVKYSGRELRRFLRRLLTASRLVIRAENYAGENVDAEFDVSGSAPALRQVLAACDDRRANEEILPLLAAG